MACGGFLERQALPLELTRYCTDTSVYSRDLLQQPKGDDNPEPGREVAPH